MLVIKCIHGVVFCTIFWGFGGIRESYTNQNLHKYGLTDMVVPSDKAVVTLQCCCSDGGCCGNDSSLALRCCRTRWLQLVRTAIYCVGFPPPPPPLWLEAESGWWGVGGVWRRGGGRGWGEGWEKKKEREGGKKSFFFFVSPPPPPLWEIRPGNGMVWQGDNAG